MVSDRTSLLGNDETPQSELKAGNSRLSAEKNIYAESIASRIKSNIRQEWERQKHLHGKTQEDLALFLKMSQGAVSKLLNNKTGHPWSVDKIELFAHFCDITVSELIEDPDLIGHFNGWLGDTPAPSFKRITEAKMALERFVEEHDETIDEPKLLKLAGRLAVRMEDTDRSPKSYNREILRLLISET